MCFTNKRKRNWNRKEDRVPDPVGLKDWSGMGVRAVTKWHCGPASFALKNGMGPNAGKNPFLFALFL